MNRIVCLVLLFFFGFLNNSFAQNFVTVWNLATAGSNPNALTFAVTTAGTVNYTWNTIPAGTSGAGSFGNGTANIAGLPTGATIELQIEPSNFQAIRLLGYQDGLRLLDVTQWGAVAWTSMRYAFGDASNLNITSADVPNLSGVTDMYGMFYLCSTLNGPVNIGTWDMSNINDVQGMFHTTTSFNQPIGTWNMGSVTSMLMSLQQAKSWEETYKIVIE